MAPNAVNASQLSQPIKSVRAFHFSFFKFRVRDCANGCGEGSGLTSWFTSRGLVLTLLSVCVAAIVGLAIANAIQLPFGLARRLVPSDWSHF